MLETFEFFAISHGSYQPLNFLPYLILSTQYPISISLTESLYGLEEVYGSGLNCFQVSCWRVNSPAVCQRSKKNNKTHPHRKELNSAKCSVFVLAVLLCYEIFSSTNDIHDCKRTNSRGRFKTRAHLFAKRPEMTKAMGINILISMSWILIIVSFVGIAQATCSGCNGKHELKYFRDDYKWSKIILPVIDNITPHNSKLNKAIGSMLIAWGGLIQFI